MAKLSTHYDNLQIARNASPEVVRAAYRGLSQKWHPDRNPPEKREECERIMRILNAAYEALSDPDSRARHDRWIAEQEFQAGSTPQRPPPAPPQRTAPSRSADPPGFDFSDSRLQPGTIRWVDARKAARDELAAAFSNRQTGFASAPMAKLSTPLGIAAAGFILVTAIALLAAQTPWGTDHVPLVFAAIVVASSIAVYGALKSYQLLASGFGRRIAVTPTHLIECDYSTITVWPLLGARRFDATHHHLNGSYSGTDIQFEHIAGGSRSFMLRSRAKAERLRGTLSDNLLRAQGAGIAYVGEIKNSALYWQPKGRLAYKNNGAPRIGVATVLLSLLAATALYYGLFAPLPLLPPLPHLSAHLPLAVTVTRPRERGGATRIDDGSELALSHRIAATGEVSVETPPTGWFQRPSQPPAVPLSISAPPDSDYFIKLVYTDGRQLGSLYLHGGETLRVNVPEGLFRIRYATGQSWYGPDLLFGPDTAYAQLRDTYTFDTDHGDSGHDLVIYGRLAGSSSEQTLTSTQW